MASQLIANFTTSRARAIVKRTGQTRDTCTRYLRAITDNDAAWKAALPGTWAGVGSNDGVGFADASGTPAPPG